MIVNLCYNQSQIRGKNMLDEYKQRILAANPVGLVVINLELCIKFIKDNSMIKAIDALQELIKSLDFQVPLSHEFYEIYKYINRLLNKAMSSNDQDASKEALELLEMLLEGWKKLETETKDIPPVNNAPKIYAGLTYGRDGSANEYVEESSKGYTV